MGGDLVEQQIVYGTDRRIGVGLGADLSEFSLADQHFAGAHLVAGIEPDGSTYRVSLVDALAGSVRSIEDVDTLVVRSPARSVDHLVAELHAAQPNLEVHTIGDAVAARWVDKAIADGHRVGRSL